MTNALSCAANVIDQYGVRLDAGNRSIEDDHRNAGRDGSADVLDVGAGRRSEKDSVCPVRAQGAQHPTLAPDLFICVRGHEKVAAVERGVFSAPDDSGEEGIGDIRKHKSKEVSLPRFEAARDSVGGVVELLHRRADTLFQFGADAFGSSNDIGDSGYRY